MGNIFDINTLLKENVLSDELLAKPYSKETFMFSAIESLKKFNENSDFNSDPKFLGYYALGMHCIGLSAWIEDISDMCGYKNVYNVFLL